MVCIDLLGKNLRLNFFHKMLIINILHDLMHITATISERMVKINFIWTQLIVPNILVNQYLPEFSIPWCLLFPFCIDDKMQ